MLHVNPGIFEKTGKASITMAIRKSTHPMGV
jgi:hypothetical protein